MHLFGRDRGASCEGHGANCRDRGGKELSDRCSQAQLSDRRGSFAGQSLPQPPAARAGAIDNEKELTTMPGRADLPLNIAGKTFTSRLLVGTGKYRNSAEMNAAFAA